MTKIGDFHLGYVFIEEKAVVEFDVCLCTADDGNEGVEGGAVMLTP